MEQKIHLYTEQTRYLTKSQLLAKQLNSFIYIHDKLYLHLITQILADNCFINQDEHGSRGRVVPQ